MKEYTLRVAAKILLGLESTQALAIGSDIERWMQLNTSTAVRLLPYDWPLFPYHRMLAHAEHLERRFKALLKQKRSQSAQQDDALALLIRGSDGSGGLSDEDLIGQVNILFIAGHETTSNALTWTLFLLAEHPALMADLLDELHGVLHGDAPTVEQLGRLPLLERVIKESLRLFPPVVYVYRVATEPFELGPYALPQRSTVALSFYVTHHLPEVYPQPEKFLPDRWRTAKPTPYMYLPFGAGPRTCIGASFSMMSLRITLAMILQRYRFEVVPRARIDRKVVITLSPRHGMPMMIHRQDRRFQKTTVCGNVHEMVDLKSP